MSVELHGERALATAMLRLAAQDAESRQPVIRERARAWLASPTCAQDRRLWLQLAGLDEQAVAERFEGSS